MYISIIRTFKTLLLGYILLLYLEDMHLEQYKVFHSGEGHIALYHSENWKKEIERRKMEKREKGGEKQ